MSPSVPLQEISGSAAAALEEFGANPSDLYRALSNSDMVAEQWIRFAWSLRIEAVTPRALRELMILRCAQAQGAVYQWRDHTAMAREAGVQDEQMSDLEFWRTSLRFDEATKTCLALTDEMISGRVSQKTLDRLAELFTPEERVELIVTVGFYCMVPRVLNALRLS